MDSSEPSLIERQDDEVQALQAIYGEDVSVDRENVSFWLRFGTHPTLQNSFQLIRLCLCLELGLGLSVIQNVQLGSAIARGRYS